MVMGRDPCGKSMGIGGPKGKRESTPTHAQTRTNTLTNTHKHARARAHTHTHTAWQDAGECGDSEILGDALVFFPHVLGRALLLSDVWVLWPPHR